MGLVLSLSMSGCKVKNDLKNGNITDNGIKYQITKSTYTDKDIKIIYPQINNFGDKDKQKTINEIIKADALAFLANYKYNVNSTEGLTFNLDYKIKYKGLDYLSIVYLGLASVKEIPYPTNQIYTSNIDLANEKDLILVNVIDSFDENFGDKTRVGKYIHYRTDLNLEDNGDIKQVLNDYGNHQLMLILKPYTAKFYLTNDSLGITLGVDHIMGDHVEIEMDYKLLKDLNVKPPMRN
ncbi:MAG TPA: DUF4163 domain-containing protein [Ruminiclostridium sp.]